MTPVVAMQPRVIWEVACQRSSDRGAKLPIKRGKQIMIQYVPLMRMWYMSLETSAHCRVSTSSVGCVVHSIDGGAQLVTGTH